MFIEKKIELVLDEKGNYLLTKEAIQIFKDATHIVAKYNTRNINECFLRVINEVKIKGDKVQVHYDMPINIYNRPHNCHFNFCGSIDTQYYRGTHPIVELVKVGCVLSFEMYKDAGTTNILRDKGLSADRLYYHIGIGKKNIVSVFDEWTRETNSPYRLTNIEQWDKNYNGLQAPTSINKF